jgi:hypothetical protein
VVDAVIQSPSLTLAELDIIKSQDRKHLIKGIKTQGGNLFIDEIDTLEEKSAPISAEFDF